jgi:nucleoside 2-deoxyribosyltransferase
MTSGHGKCIFCGTLVKSQAIHGIGGVEYRCVHCGNYVLDSELKILLENPKHCFYDKRHIVSGYFAETKSSRNYSGASQEDNLLKCFIDKSKFESILTDHVVPKTIIQKLDKLLIYLHKSTEYFGQEHEIKKIPLSAAYVRDKSEIDALIKEAINLRYGNFKELEAGAYGYGGGGDVPKDIDLDKRVFILSIKGHSRTEELLATNTNSVKVFVAMGFKDDLLEAMKNSIQPACSDCGFDAYLISDKEHNNGITDEIIIAIKTSKFVIADFTYNNCGAYFEAGYAQGLGLEVIRCCKKDWFDGTDEYGNTNRMHFDIQHYNIILWENEEDLRKKLKNRIRATIPNSKMED